MSTRVYNGYRLPQLSLTELNIGIQLLRGVAQSAAREMQKQRQLEIAVNVLDKHALRELRNSDYEGQRWEGRSPMALSWQILMAKSRQIVLSQRRDPVNDFTFEVQIIPRDSKILALLYVEQEVFTPLFEDGKCYGNKSPLDVRFRRPF